MIPSKTSQRSSMSLFERQRFPILKHQLSRHYCFAYTLPYFRRLQPIDWPKRQLERWKSTPHPLLLFTCPTFSGITAHVIPFVRWSIGSYSTIEGCIVGFHCRGTHTAVSSAVEAAKETTQRYGAYLARRLTTHHPGQQLCYLHTPNAGLTTPVRLILRCYIDSDSSG